MLANENTLDSTKKLQSSDHLSNLTERQWYVAYCKPQQEESAQLHLRLKGLEVFFPRLLLPKPNQRRRRVVPLFPNYLFVRLHFPKEFHNAVWSPGVKRLLGFGGIPAPLNDGIVSFLLQRATSEGILPACCNLRARQEVQLSGGPFDGLVGVIQDPPDARGRIRVLLKLLNRQLKVIVPVHFIKSGWVVAGEEGNSRFGSTVA